jgi:hypothetical protein
MSPAIPSVVLLACAAATMPPTEAASSSSSVVLRGRRVAVEVDVRDGRLHERYLASRRGTWVEVATGDQPGNLGPVTIVDGDGAPMAGAVRGVARAGEALVEELALGDHRIERRLTVAPEDGWIHVVTRLEPAGPLRLHHFADRYTPVRRPDWSFSPSVGGFNPDAQYKAPLILVQSGSVAFGIVPDVLVLDRETLKRCNHALDLDVPGGPVLTVGFIPARQVSHSVYGPDPGRSWTATGPVENAYDLLLGATEEPAGAFRRAVRFHWERFGRVEQARAGRQQVGTDPAYRGLALWDEWRKKVWEEEPRRLWLEVPLPDGSRGGGVGMRRWGDGPSVYLSSWFNSLRTSFGMALYARRTGSAELLARARETVELALGAPGRDGAFKCIAVPAANGRPTAWAAGDGAGDSTRDGFLGYDMSWTGYWLLRWRAAGLPGAEKILPRARRLAEFLAARQEVDGMLPTRFAEDGSVAEALSRTVKAETGPVALFLLTLHEQDPDPRWLAAATKGLAFLERDVIPERQWYDYETFWSCARREPRRDERTGQWPANDLALGQTVAAYLAAYRTSGDGQYLETGKRLLDYLLLYQQCWTNPALEDLSGPAMLLGGFTTQNNDAEWSDARQSQSGNVLLEAYRLTGNVEYLERGVAALRAQFPVSPAENWAHEGYGGRSGISSFHWGTGSGMAGIEIAQDFLADAVVDVAAGRGVGVNGIDLAACAVGRGEIRLGLTSPFRWSRPARVVFRRTEPGRAYRVFVNGVLVGIRRGEDLGRGIEVAPAP